MKNFTERKTYGDVAEEYAHKILTELKIPFITSREYWGEEWTNELDGRYGDIQLYPGSEHFMWIDVKRNSIPIKSLNKFEGDYFWLFHHIVENYSMLITKDEVLSQPNLNESILSSGDPGYKIKDIESPQRGIHNLIRSSV